MQSLCEDLVMGFTNSDFDSTEENLNAFYNFLLMAGQNDLLVRFALKQAKNKAYQFPWGHFLEALSQAHFELEDQVLELVRQALNSTPAQYEASRCKKWDSLFANIDLWRSQKKWEQGKKGPLLRKQLFEELEVARLQQLYEAEDSVLQKLKKMFLNDADVEKEIQTTRERKAYDVLNKYDSIQNPQFAETSAPALDQEENLFINSIKEAQTLNPEMTYDLALACWMLEDFSGALEILNQAGHDKSRTIWFEIEILVKTRRYLDVLEMLPQVELSFSNDPETFFATALLRAQAFWGLGQKNTAIEILESLISTRPHYRSASVLLNQWRGL